MAKSEVNSIIDTAGLFNGILHKLLATGQGLHVETLITSAARMSGTMLVRNWHADSGLQPGTVLLSDEADRQGPGLVDALLQTLHRLGHPRDRDRGFGVTSLSTDLSQLTLAQTLLEPWYRKAQQVSGLSDQAAATAAAVSTAMQIHQCRDIIEVEPACGLAVNALVESMKTVPVSLVQAASE
jgi:hypothetical protein